MTGMSSAPDYAASERHADLRALLDHAVDAGFLTQADRDLVTILDTVDDVIEALTAGSG